MYIKIVLPVLIFVVVWYGVGGAGHDEGQGGQEENEHRKPHLIEGSGESGFHGVFIHPHMTVTPSPNTFSYSHFRADWFV